MGAYLYAAGRTVSVFSNEANPVPPETQRISLRRRPALRLCTPMTPPRI